MHSLASASRELARMIGRDVFGGRDSQQLYYAIRHPGQKWQQRVQTGVQARQQLLSKACTASIRAWQMSAPSAGPDTPWPMAWRVSV
jgi:hypothetical protein